VEEPEQQFEEPEDDDNELPVINMLLGHPDAGNNRTATAAPIHSSRQVLPKNGPPWDGREYPRTPQSRYSNIMQEDPSVDSTASDLGQDPAPPISIKLESQSDTPIVVSTRNVRKRKRRNETEVENSVKVKEEVISSSPLGLAALQNLLSQENLDLDEIGEKVNTPKKKRQANETLHANNERSTSQPNSSLQGNTAALQPMSPNKQILPRTSGKRLRVENSLLGARIFGEDADYDDVGVDSISATTPTWKPKNHSRALSADIEQRLTGLLENPSPRNTIFTPQTPLNASVARGSRITGFVGQQEPLPTTERRTISILRQSATCVTPNQCHPSRGNASDQRSAISVRRPALRTPESIAAPNHNTPNHIPLRNRNVHDLGLSHFKINPNFNQGYDYAFADIVRGREQRKCLPGCIKPECCGGKFRKFVELTKFDEDRSESQDKKLLEEYLGDNRRKLQTMSKAERNELLIQAETRELARKAGRHRHAYERRPSPPGFWRSDFPNTQELEADRIEAARVETELVQQRYEEAMRPGGRWMFRDE
jgi:hypothetical protein